LKAAIGRHQVGDVVTGMISGIVDWGAFIKWGAKEEALEGLIHISELDWQLIEKPSDFIKVGDEVKAQIIDILNDRVSLSLKRLKADPWKTASAILEKGMIIDGSVKKFNPYGAFVEIACGKDGETLQGLCHISEFGSDEKMRSSLETGKRYQFKIMAFVPEEHRMSLGLLREETPIESAEAPSTAKISDEIKAVKETA
jgi:small subunit ribosomal protein S1